MKNMNKKINNASFATKLMKFVEELIKKNIFSGSRKYWESRYNLGKTSGAGSYGQFAEFKAQVLNSFMADHNISSVIEFGCGDGNQLSLVNYNSYTGLDISRKAIILCKERFKDDKTKSFFLYDTDCFVDMSAVFNAELVLSLDVIYHLVEDNVFELYMKHLFSASDKFVMIYSSNTEANKSLQAPHVKHRYFTKWVESNLPEWKLIDQIKNERVPEGYEDKEVADFFIYEKI